MQTLLINHVIIVYFRRVSIEMVFRIQNSASNRSLISSYRNSSAQLMTNDYLNSKYKLKPKSRDKNITKINKKTNKHERRENTQFSQWHSSFHQVRNTGLLYY